MIPTLSLNLLAKFRNNIYIEMENQYGLTIEKKVEVDIIKHRNFTIAI